MEWLITSMRATLEKDPTNLYARFELANGLAAAGEHAEAVRELDRVVAQDPDYEDGAAWYNRGNSLSALGRLEEAIASYGEAMARPFEGRSAAAGNQALVLEHLGRTDEAAAVRARIEEWATAEAQASMAQGEQHFVAERWAEALAFYEDAAQRPWPGAHVAILNGAICHDHLGRGEDALRWVDECLRRAPDWPPAVLHKGIFLSGLKRAAEALPFIERALALTGPEPLGLFNRAEVCAALGRREEALADLARAIELAPEMRAHLADPALFPALRTDPRFQVLVQG